MTPSKLELLAPWLPAQEWYVAAGRAPGALELSRAGGFRLDDPEGEVGIEFMVVTDRSGDRPVSYHVPVSYRGAPLDGVDARALVGTSEHGVLGTRWVYDGAHDPVLVGQLLALLQGRAEPQAQNVSDTPDPSVSVHGPGSAGPAAGFRSASATSGPRGTSIAVETTEPAGPLTIEVARVLGEAGADVTGTRGHVTAGWQGPDGGEHRGVFFVLRD